MIKALPQLQKLDNVVITREELQEAQRRGKTLYYPHEMQEESEEEYAPLTPPKNRNYNYGDYSPPFSPDQQESPPRQEVSCIYDVAA